MRLRLDLRARVPEGRDFRTFVDTTVMRGRGFERGRERRITAVEEDMGVYGDVGKNTTENQREE